MKAFDNSEFEKYKAEAREKWGQTDAYREHTEKTENYSQNKWQSASDGLDAMFGKFAVCMNKGERPESEPALELVRQLQQYITENFYTCTNEILSGLGKMYVLDERFKNNIDKHGEGTAVFVSKAIEIYTKA